METAPPRPSRTDLRLAPGYRFLPWLRPMRVCQGWTQERLANEAGLGLRTIRRLEAGYSAQPCTIRALAQAFGVPRIVLLSIGPRQGSDAPPSAFPQHLASDPPQLRALRWKR